MRIVDLTYSVSSNDPVDDTARVMVQYAKPVNRIPPDYLLAQATVVDVTDRRSVDRIHRCDLVKTGVADIAGCILHTGWMDARLAGVDRNAPQLTVEAAAYLLEGGVRIVAADFPLTSYAADLLLQNGCVLACCLSNIQELDHEIVRLVVPPLKYRDLCMAPARAMAIESE